MADEISYLRATFVLTSQNIEKIENILYETKDVYISKDNLMDPNASSTMTFFKKPIVSKITYY